MDAAGFTAILLLIVILFGRKPLGGARVPELDAIRREFAAGLMRVVGTVGGGWLVYGPGWLPWWASLAVAYATGALCEKLTEWLTDRCGDPADPEGER